MTENLSMSSDSKTAVICVTEKGIELGVKIAEQLNCKIYYPKKLTCTYEHASFYESLTECFDYLFHNYTGIVAVMAQGITTRMIAPFIKSKYTDPAVVACDEVGRFAVSALSGHEGGANKLAYAVSSITGAEPVITTATEANRLYIAGIGCRKDTNSIEIIDALNKACEIADIKIADIRMLASAWIKSNEKGLLEAAEKSGLYIRFLPEKAFIFSSYKFENSTASKHFSIPAVAEPSAVISAKNPEIILKKTIFGSVTISIIKEKISGE